MWYVVTHGSAAEQLSVRGEPLSGLCAPVRPQGPTRRRGALDGLDLPVPGRWSGIVDVMPPTTRKHVRLDLDLLDPEDPFEIDGGNRVHMIKHLPSDDAGKPVAVGPEDVLDLYLYGDPDYYPAKEDGPADWLMIGMFRDSCSASRSPRRTAGMLDSVDRSASTRRP